MKVTNRHERILRAPPERIAGLIADLDRIWATDVLAPPRRVSHRQYKPGVMLWEEFDRPGALQAFRVITPDELTLEHWFEVESVGDATVLRHVVEGYPTGKGRASWEQMEPRHDLAVEAIAYPYVGTSAQMK